MGVNNPKSINSIICSLKAGETVELPLSVRSAISSAKTRAKYQLAPQIPQWEEEIDYQKATITITRTA